MECRHGNFWIGLGIGSILGAVVYRLSRTAKAKQLESEIYDAIHRIGPEYFYVFVHTLPFFYSFCLFSVIKSLSFLFCIHSLECFFLMFLSFFLCLITCICLLSLR